MRVRVRPDRVHLYPSYRRVGFTFGPEWTTVADGALTPEQAGYLVSASGHALEIEGSPAKTAAPPGTPTEAVTAASAAGVSLPGHPTAAEAARATEAEDDTEPKGRGRRGR